MHMWYVRVIIACWDGEKVGAHCRVDHSKLTFNGI